MPYLKTTRVAAQPLHGGARPKFFLFRCPPKVLGKEGEIAL